MNCSELAILTPLYLAGELDPKQSEDFAEHLNVCQTCARDVSTEQVIDKALRDTILDEPIDASEVERQVRASIRAESRQRVMAALAIAAVIVMAFVGNRVMLASRAKVIYAAAANDHLREIVQKEPRHWRTDENDLSRLLSSQGVSMSVANTIAPAGYHLAEGRICILNGRKFLHLVYADAAGNVSVFLRQQTPRFASGGVAAFASEHVAGVQKDALTAVVVSDESEASALRFARSIKAAL